jgi:hypothetical protein
MPKYFGDAWVHSFTVLVGADFAGS